MKQSTRVDNTGEVFTPRSLIRAMLDRLPDEAWLDPNRCWLEPSAGDGNFLEEIKNRLVYERHKPRHVLDNMLFSVELIDENHYALQVRLGYLQHDPNSNKLIPGKLWAKKKWDTFFKVDTLHDDAIKFNDERNPYDGKIVFVNGEEYTLKRHEVYHHVNHLCGSFLDPLTAFEDRPRTNLPVLPGPVKGWPADDRDIGEKITYVSTLFPRDRLEQKPKKQNVKKSEKQNVKKFEKQNVKKSEKQNVEELKREPKSEETTMRPTSASIGTQQPITKEEVEQLLGRSLKVKASNRRAQWLECNDKVVIAFSDGGGSSKDFPEDAIYLVKTEHGFFYCSKKEWCDNGTIRTSAGYLKGGMGQMASDRYNSKANRPYKSWSS